MPQFFYYIFIFLLFIYDLVKFKFKIRKEIFLIIILSGVSISGFLVWSDMNLIKCLRAFINYLVILILLNNTVYWIKNRPEEIILLNLKFINYFMVFLCVLGFLQFIGILEIDSRSYITYSGSLDSSELLRVTSIFDEPSSFAYFLCAAYYFNRKYLKNIKYLIVYVLTILLTISLTGYLVLFLIEIINLKMKNIFKLFLSFSIGIIILYFFSSDIRLIFSLIWLRITDGAFGGYRVLAPLKAINLTINNLFSFLFGYGLTSLGIASKSFNLLETPATTHNFFVDILFEIGLAGLFLNVFYIFSNIKTKYLKLTLFIFLLVGTGYRSSRFLFIFSLFVLGGYFIDEERV